MPIRCVCVANSTHVGALCELSLRLYAIDRICHSARRTLGGLSCTRHVVLPTLAPVSRAIVVDIYLFLHMRYMHYFHCNYSMETESFSVDLISQVD